MSTTPGSTSPAPRRLVLLQQGEDSAVESVLHEYAGSEIRGSQLHAELQRKADEYPGRCIAAEWLGPLGWTRFLWCKKSTRRGEE